MVNRFVEQIVDDFKKYLGGINSRDGIPYSDNSIVCYAGDARGFINGIVNGERSKGDVLRTVGNLDGLEVGEHVVGRNSTKRRKNFGISMLFDYLIQEGVVKNNPFDGRESFPKEYAGGEQRVYIDRDTLNRTLAMASSCRKDAGGVWGVFLPSRADAMIRVSYDGALQSKDLITLNWDNFDEKLRELKPLGNNMCAIELSDYTNISLGRYKEFYEWMRKNRDIEPKHLWLNRSLGGLNIRSYRREVIDGFFNPAYKRVVRKQNEENGIEETPRVVSHRDLRFSRGIEWLKEGKTPGEINQILGLTSRAFTNSIIRRYNEMAEGDILEEFDFSGENLLVPANTLP